MDPKPSSGMLLAPSHGSSARAVYAPAARAFPPLDETIVKPETREEIVRGRRMLAQPALEPHADQHFKLDYILGAHVKPEYVGSSDLLTRPAEGSNFATDTCIRRAGTDPATRKRYLEEVSFEIVNEQSLSDITERAEDLVARGVRRVFAIFVKEGRIAEWKGAWDTLAANGTIRDRVLARPLHVQELLDAAEASNAVARGLLAQNNAVLVAANAESMERGIEMGREQGLVEGEKKGLREAIERMCGALGIELTPPRRAHVSALDAAALGTLLAHIGAERRWP